MATILNKRNVGIASSLGILIIVPLCFNLFGFDAPNKAVGTRTESSEEQSVDDAVRIMNGTWKLAKRVNPDGTEHAKVDGVTTMDLQKIHSKLLGARAIGAVQAREVGEKLDHRFGSCVPPESADKPFFIESVGSWEMTVESDNAKEAILKVKQSASVVGDFRPYKEGLVSDLTQSYRLVKTGPSGPHLELIGRLHFTEATTLKGAALAAVAALSQSCCDVQSLTITNAGMKINWSNGGKDVWEKTSPTVSGSQFR